MFGLRLGLGFNPASGASGGGGGGGGGGVSSPATVYALDEDASAGFSPAVAAISVDFDASSEYVIEGVAEYTSNGLSSTGPFCSIGLPTGAVARSNFTPNVITNTRTVTTVDDAAMTVSGCKGQNLSTGLGILSIIRTDEAGTGSLTYSHNVGAGTTTTMKAGSRLFVRKVPDNQVSRLSGNVTSEGTSDWESLASIAVQAGKAYAVRLCGTWERGGTGGTPKFRLTGLGNNKSVMHVRRNRSTLSSIGSDVAFDGAECMVNASSGAGTFGAALEIVIHATESGTVSLEFASNAGVDCTFHAGTAAAWWETTATRLADGVTHSEAASWATVLSAELEAGKEYLAILYAGWQRTPSTNVTPRVRIASAPSTQVANVPHSTETTIQNQDHRRDDTLVTAASLFQDGARLFGAHAYLAGGAGGTALFQISPSTDVDITALAGSVLQLEEVTPAA